MDNSPFKSLPGELRNAVYRLALDLDAHPFALTSMYVTTKGHVGWFNGLGHDISRNLRGIAGACRETRNEALGYLFANTHLELYPVRDSLPSTDMENYFCSATFLDLLSLRPHTFSARSITINFNHGWWVNLADWKWIDVVISKFCSRAPTQIVVGLDRFDAEFNYGEPRDTIRRLDEFLHEYSTELAYENEEICEAVLAHKLDEMRKFKIWLRKMPRTGIASSGDVRMDDEMRPQGTKRKRYEIEEDDSENSQRAQLR